MARLVEWADEAGDFTTNRGVKPSLIYIVNQDNRSDFSAWRDTSHATNEMLRKWRASRRFIDEQKRWQARGVAVETADQLLRCYYRDVTVVFIPQFLPDHKVCGANELREQYDTLYGQIGQQSFDSSEKRRVGGLLFDLEAFSRSSIRVLKQLAENPHCILDLKDLAEPLREQPTNFTHHVLNILRRLQEQAEQVGDAEIQTEVRLIQKAIPYLVASVAGEVLRAQGKSNHAPDRTSKLTWADNNFSDGTIATFGISWKRVLEQFNQDQCRCEEVFRGQRCQNYRHRHSHGHQFALKDAGRLQAGNFKSDFSNRIETLHKTFISGLTNSNILRRRTFSKLGRRATQTS
jgi:hypothetical protein